MSTGAVWLVLVCGLTTAAAGSDPATQQSARTPVFGTTVVNAAGLRGDIYLIRKGTTRLPDFDQLEPVGSIWTTTLKIPPRHWRDGFPGVTKRREWFAIHYTGRIWIEKPGVYLFALGSDDGSRLYVDDQPVIDNDCQHPPEVRIGSVVLSGGIHRIRVPYFQGPRDCIALVLAVAPPHEEWRWFSTEDFKPPVNPDDWQYGSVADLERSADPAVSDAGRTKLRSVLGLPAETPTPNERPRHSLGDPGEGCVVYPPPLPFCGK